jgi:hypothetical protein
MHQKHRWNPALAKVEVVKRDMVPGQRAILHYFSLGRPLREQYSADKQIESFSTPHICSVPRR